MTDTTMPPDAADDLVEAIEREAVAKAGSSDFGEPHYRAVLQAWAQDLLAPVLSDFGRAFLRRLAVNAMVRRLRTTGC
ncbi:MAG TPA: hypothetical protein VJV78_33235 [Polyangiales bacterium]|nr:hypothetical protein [Polyangiales bacterium]